MTRACVRLGLGHVLPLLCACRPHPLRTTELWELTFFSSPRSVLCAARGFLLHLHHRAAGPRQVSGVSEKQLPTTAGPARQGGVQVRRPRRLEP